MKTRYNSVIVYQVTATCESPFRCGNGENDIETVLQDHQGSYFIPGTSLAGAFRDFAEANGKGSLFGSTKEEGALVFSDGIFQENTKLVLRPRLSMDHNTGTGKEGGKFDMAHLEKGSVFTWSLTWLGDEQERGEESLFLKRALSALHHGQILLGGQKNNGFGRVSLGIMEKHFRLTREKERQEWLSDTWKGFPMVLNPPEKTEGLSLHIQGKMDKLLVKDKIVDQVTMQMREAGVPVIPASSFRGVLRHRVESIAQMIGLEEDFVSLLFGSSDHRGALSFHDVYLTEGKSNKISRIHINKFTGGVMPQALFTEENFASSVAWEIKLDQAFPQQEKAMALLLFALRDMALGLVTLGSGGAHGCGVVEIASVAVKDGKKKQGSFTMTENKEIHITDEKISRFFQGLEGVS